MGAYTPTAQVFYPDVTDTAKLDTLLATVASSIEDGLGARMNKAELTQSFLANKTSDQTFVNGTGQTVTYSITSLGYNDGMSFSSSTITITQAGLYFFTFNGTVISSSGSSSGSCKFSIRKNGNALASALALIAPNGATSAGAASASCVTKCVAGDTINIYALFQGSTAGTLVVSGASTDYNIFSGALLKAL